MNTNFKPLGLVAAVAAATAGYTGVTQAQDAEFAGTGLGDAAIVPYYTVQGDFVTGVHITNTSDLTQVVKLRFRRASDSMDALDFNIIMSPFDMWTGFIKDDDGTISVGTSDTSCTAPLTVQATGVAEMPDIFREGAEEGYIEIIGMGSATADQLIAIGSDHGTTGTPADCASVETNFFRNATGSTAAVGVVSDTVSHQSCSAGLALAVPLLCPTATTIVPQNLLPAGDALNVTYFVRSAETGTEFGSRAVHLSGFGVSAMMSNQEIIVTGTGTTDFLSFLYPNLDGGSPAGASTGRFDGVRTALGAQTVINEWSTNSANAVSTDWVVTMPGQYLMLNLPVYGAILDAGGSIDNCLSAAEIAAILPVPVPLPLACDARDLPVEVAIRFWDREEQKTTTPQGGLVISPATTDTPDTALLENEVNVIEWTDGVNAPVLDSAYATSFDVSALGAPNGWAQLAVTSDKAAGAAGVFIPTTVQDIRVVDETLVPIVGFAAWERSFANNPGASYGRLIDHAYVGASTTTTAPAP
ncbi:MAG: hypothetical protein V7700_18660 [Halioglobus sp.]